MSIDWVSPLPATRSTRSLIASGAPGVFGMPGGFPERCPDYVVEPDTYKTERCPIRIEHRSLGRHEPVVLSVQFLIGTPHLDVRQLGLPIGNVKLSSGNFLSPGEMTPERRKKVQQP